MFCGSTDNVEIQHVDGDEHNHAPRNLAWACRSCNVTVAAVMKRAGIGRRTRQFNPNAQGVRTLSQWVTAVLSMKGQSDAMEPAAAIEMIHATPPGAPVRVRRRNLAHPPRARHGSLGIAIGGKRNVLFAVVFATSFCAGCRGVLFRLSTLSRSGTRLFAAECIEAFLCRLSAQERRAPSEGT